MKDVRIRPLTERVARPPFSYLLLGQYVSPSKKRKNINNEQALGILFETPQVFVITNSLRMSNHVLFQNHNDL